MAKGLDVGSNYIVSAKQNKNNVMLEKRRNTFLDLEKSSETEKILNKLKISYIKRLNKIIVVGENALTLANSFGREARRPMAMGIISNKDDLSLDVLPDILSDVLGSPEKPNEICCFTIPAKVIGIEEFDVDYHKDTLFGIVKKLGFSPVYINEAMCVAYDCLQDDNYTGINLSFGAGLVNIAVSHLGITTQAFSLPRSGDYLDRMIASRKLGMTASKAMKIKESQVDPIHIIKDNGSKDLIRDAIAKYYRIYLEWVVKNLENAFANLILDEPIPISVAGGTSLIQGFMEVFEDYMSKASFRFKISKFIHAKDALHSVARGALIKALLEEDLE